MNTLAVCFALVVAGAALCVCALGLAWLLDAFVLSPIRARRQRQIDLLRAMQAEPVDADIAFDADPRVPDKYKAMNRYERSERP